VPHGKGTLQFKNDPKGYYEGYWKNGVRHGKGVREHEKGKLEATWVDGKVHFGTYEWQGHKYEGNFKDRFFNGEGTLYN